MKSKGTAIVVKLATLESGREIERVIFRGHLKECKEKIPPSKKGQFRIDFKGTKK